MTCQRGIALITVLWTLTILALLAAAIGDLTHAESAMVRNLGLNAKAEAMADAGIHRALASLLDAETPDDDFDFTMPEGTVRVSIADEDGKVDLNAVQPAALVRLLLGLGLSPSLANQLADAIADYRDPDGDRRSAGAERPEYRAAGRQQGPKNAAFASKEELLLVLGIDPGLFRRLQDVVTVSTGSSAFDPRVAPAEALHALPPDLKAWASRLSGFRLSDPLAMALPADPGVTATRQVYYTLQAEACLRHQKAHFVRQAIVKLERRSSTRPFQILAWKRPLFFKAPPSPCQP